MSEVKPKHSLLTFLTYPVHREQYVHSPVPLNDSYCEGVKWILFFMSSILPVHTGPYNNMR